MQPPAIAGQATPSPGAEQAAPAKEGQASPSPGAEQAPAVNADDDAAARHGQIGARITQVFVDMHDASQDFADGKRMWPRGQAASSDQQDPTPASADQSAPVSADQSTPAIAGPSTLAIAGQPAAAFVARPVLATVSSMESLLDDQPWTMNSAALKWFRQEHETPPRNTDLRGGRHSAGPLANRRAPTR